jgi:hypothetical protein
MRKAAVLEISQFAMAPFSVALGRRKIAVWAISGTLVVGSTEGLIAAVATSDQML